MGKVGSILLTAVSVVAAIETLGISSIIGFGTALSGAIGIGGATLVTGALTVYGVSSALSAASGLFGPSLPLPEIAERQARTPRPPRVYIYGFRRNHMSMERA